MTPIDTTGVASAEVQAFKVLNGLNAAELAIPEASRTEDNQRTAVTLDPEAGTVTLAVTMLATFTPEANGSLSVTPIDYLP